MPFCPLPLHSEEAGFGKASGALEAWIPEVQGADQADQSGHGCCTDARYPTYGDVTAMLMCVWRM